MKGIIKSIVTVGGYTLFYRITSVVRDIIQASVLGATFLSDVFALVFKLANITRKIFSEGAFNASFLPKFVYILKESGKKEATFFASQVFTLLFSIVGIITAICLYYFPELMQCYASKFYGTYKFQYVIDLGRICFFYVFSSFLFALLAGVLNGINKFAIPTASQLLLNIFLIIAMLAGGGLFDSIVYAMCYATALAGFAQVFVLWLNARHHGFTIKFVKKMFSPDVKEFLIKLVPGAIGAGVWQINMVINVVVASSLAVGSISYIYYADHVNQFAVGILGIALSTGILPYMSSSIKSNNYNDANYQLNVSIIFTMAFALPLTAIFLAIPATVTAAIYEGGKFLMSDVIHASHALFAFAIGLPSYILTKIFSTAFFAEGKTNIPSIIGGLSIIVNVIFLYMLVTNYQHVGIALSTTISSWFNALGLYICIRKENKFFIYKDTKVKLLKQTILALLCGIFAFYLNAHLEPLYVCKSSKVLWFLFILGSTGLIFFAIGSVMKCLKMRKPEDNTANTKNS